MMKSIMTGRLGHLTLLVALVSLPACEGPTGPEGEPGEDGNANVTTVSLDAEDVTWTEGAYLGRAANEYTFNPSEVTQDVVDHGTVLGYANLSNNWHPLPFSWESTDGSTRQDVTFTYTVESITLYAYQTGGTLDPGAISEYRFLTATDNTVTSSASSGESIVSAMEQAGVDVEDYHEVAAYLGVSD